MTPLRIGVVGPSNTEINGPVFREARKEAEKHLGHRITMESPRLNHQYHAMLVEEGSVSLPSSAVVTVGHMSALPPGKPDEKFAIVKGALITVGQQAILNACVR
jgi:hypothetical protein